MRESHTKSQSSWKQPSTGYHKKKLFFFPKVLCWLDVQISHSSCAEGTKHRGMYVCIFNWLEKRFGNSQVLISYLTTTHTAATGLSSHLVFPGVYRFLPINRSRQESDTATVPSPSLENCQVRQAVLQRSHARSRVRQSTELADYRADHSLQRPKGCCKYQIITHMGMPRGSWALCTVLSFHIARTTLQPDREGWGAVYWKLRTGFSPIVITISVIHWFFTRGLWQLLSLFLVVTDSQLLWIDITSLI